jgi:hypothetical protein
MNHYKKLAFIVIFLLIASLSFYFFYSPRFSIYLIQESITKKDKEAFLKYVDVDLLIENFVQQIILKEVELQKSENPIQKFKSYIKKEILENIQPTLKNFLKESLLAYFDHSIPEKLPSFYRKEWDVIPTLIYINTQYRIKKIEYENPHTAIVEYEIFLKDQTTYNLKLKFERKNFYWKLIAIPNLYDFILKMNE